MKAILIKEKGGAENLVLKDYEKPVAREGSVLIKILAFGINRAEIYMRRGDWGDTTDIIGIECVGLVENDPSGNLKKGQQVAALVGGMSRNINGSYAEYTNVPMTNVVPFRSGLPWNELAAIPETYATAWAILNWCLEANRGETLLVRGGTSTVGMAGVVLARQMGMNVIATTRNPGRIGLLKKLGATAVIVDEGRIDMEVMAIEPGGVDQVMELVGTASLEDSMSCIRPRGGICLAGFLGGMKPIEQFQPIFQIPSGVRVTTLASAFAFGQKGFELSAIPLQKIITDIEEGRIPNILSRSFKVVEIAEAHRLVETNMANGKVVVEW
jgi:NADPH:quinone reductase-like Zn-dependent oxidoreductase